METQRQQKINKLLQRDLSKIFQIEMRSVVPGVMVSVTKVVITSDLSIARIYLSIFATTKKKEAVEKIKTHTKEIRGHLGKRIGMQLRIIPNLQFFLDDSLDYLENIDNLLKNG
jgi:ribosome-binding factor A